MQQQQQQQQQHPLYGQNIIIQQAPQQPPHQHLYHVQQMLNPIQMYHQQPQSPQQQQQYFQHQLQQQQSPHRHHQQQQQPQYIHPPQQQLPPQQYQQQQQPQSHHNHHHTSSSSSSSSHHQTSNSHHHHHHHSHHHHHQEHKSKSSTPTPTITPVSNSNQNSSSNAYLALLRIAEQFRQKQNYRLTIHCLESILALKPPIDIQSELQIHLKLANIYILQTQNTTTNIIAHLDKAVSIIKHIKTNDESKYEAIYMIYKYYQDINQSYPIDLLRENIESSKLYPIWHLRYLFLIGDMCLTNKDYQTAAHYMSMGIEYSSANNHKYTHILFILCKGLIHLLQRNTADLQNTMQPCASLIENYQTPNQYKVESLKIFFLILQVTYYLQCGQMKSVRNTLKTLQHYVQSLSNRSEDELAGNDLTENFQWLSKDQLGILAYLLTIIHALQSGGLDKAQKFTEKALSNIQKLKSKQSSNLILKQLNLLLLENVIRCRIAIGNRKDALKEICEAFQICKEEPKLFNTHISQLHILLGLYALSMNCLDAAESQFTQALRSTNETDLWLYGAFNLALVYLNANKQQQLIHLIENLCPENIQTHNTAFSACSHLMRALKFFCTNNYQQAQESLREAILLANSEDIISLSANAVLFMGHLNLLLHLFQDSFNALTNGYDTAEKLPDINLRLYGALQLKNLYGCCNDAREQQLAQKHNELTQLLALDYFEATKSSKHNLIRWSDNAIPSIDFTSN